jgi:hypothetical protein
MKGDALGICTYQLRINQRIIAEFEHNRVDGLTVCLQKAAKAVEKEKWEGLIEVFKENKMCDE